MVPSTETLCLENILSEEENAWPWQLPHSDSVDLKTKRRAFDILNAIRRLQEEKKIVLIEMDHHWRALQTRGDGLKELSCLLSNLPWVLSEEGLRGLQSTILRKRQNITERKLQARLEQKT
ncbi:Parafibromin [Dissostichus eleginoides]|uniref:Parafibromin n=1 Tax=Dissostichus eleginoides TaxID=100907 RepID=A0AAD9BPL3_DISEL|nr:Parafibromin [Dissostichus eleginoides]